MLKQGRKSKRGRLDSSGTLLLVCARPIGSVLGRSYRLALCRLTIYRLAIYRLARCGLPLLALAASCGRPNRDEERAAAVARAAERLTQGPGGKANPDEASRPAEPTRDNPPTAGSAPSPSPADEAQAVASPPAGEPPDLTALKARIIAGDSSSRAMKALQVLGSKYQKNQDIPYLLGQLYFEKLWVGDGIKNLRRAIQLDPLYRSNPYVIRAAIGGLGNDRDQAQVHRFLVQDIGKPAAPYLEEVLYGDWRQQVKERAAAILRELQ